MKTRTTLLLLALTIGLGAWMLLRDNAPPDLGGHLLFDWSANVTEKAEVKVDVDPAEVGGIDLKSSTVQISLRKGPDGGWELTGGVKDRADEAFVKQLVDYCRTAKIESVISQDELTSGAVSASSLGLDEAHAWRVSWLRAAARRW